MAIPNLTDYANKKSKGLISIQKIDSNNMAIATKQFDSSDGSALPAQVTGVTIAEVDRAISDKQAELAQLQAFEADLKAAT